jgi:hypothetical protein
MSTFGYGCKTLQIKHIALRRRKCRGGYGHAVVDVGVTAMRSALRLVWYHPQSERQGEMVSAIAGVGWS